MPRCAHVAVAGKSPSAQADRTAALASADSITAGDHRDHQTARVAADRCASWVFGRVPSGGTEQTICAGVSFS